MGEIRHDKAHDSGESLRVPSFEFVPIPFSEPALSKDQVFEIEELGFVPPPANTDPLIALQLRRDQLLPILQAERDPEGIGSIDREIAAVETEMGPRLITSLSVHSEFDTLRAVLVGTANTLLSVPKPEAICKTIQRAVDEGRLEPLHEYVRHSENICTHLDPNDIEIVGEGHRVHPALIRDLRERTEKQIEAVVKVLEEHGVTVLRPHHLHTQEQMFAQDPINVVGDKLIVSNMAEPARRGEYKGLEPHFAALKPEKIVRLPEGVILEGGDLMVHNGTIFVGVNGPRTNGEAVKFLEEQFPEKKVVPIELASKHDPHDVLHLDCCLGFAGKNHAGQDVLVVYEDGIKNITKALNPDFQALLSGSDVIRISRAEQEKLGTNFIPLSPHKVISGTDTPEVNAELRKRGIEVIEVDVGLVKLWGGAFRCLSHPLVRGQQAELATVAAAVQAKEFGTYSPVDSGRETHSAGPSGAALNIGVASSRKADWMRVPDPITQPDEYAAWQALEGA